METFIYKDLKKASLEKDFTKVLTLGPYAVTLYKIIYKGFENKLLSDQQLLNKYILNKLYRGILIDKEIYNQQFVENVFSTGQFQLIDKKFVT